MNRKNNYDVIIIGSGIGGLVCGSYLTRAGLKVLIVEKNHQVGGYCSSFKSGDFTFDRVISGLVGCSVNGPMGKVLDKLDLLRKIEFKRINPSHLIILSDRKIKVMNDSFATEDTLKSKFPEEAYNIEFFFALLRNRNFFSILAKIKNKSFSSLINSYFKNEFLKNFWYMLRANSGISPSESSALADILLIRGYILDGGYYPKGGMQNFVEIIKDNFTKNGGELKLLNQVTRVVIEQSRVKGIMLKDGSFLKSKYIVSNCDVVQTFSKLIDHKNANSAFVQDLKKLITSPSAFIVHLGINKDLKKLIGDCCSIWYSDRSPDENEYNLEKISHPTGLLSIFFPSFHNKSFAPKGKTSVCILIGSAYKSKLYWERNKNVLARSIIKKASSVIPGLSSTILEKTITTPYDLYESTLNHKGASRGWSTLLSQTGSRFFYYQPQIKGLFLAGHWSMGQAGGGVTMSSYSGITVAKSILNDLKLKEV